MKKLMMVLVGIAAVLSGCSTPAYDVTVYISPKFLQTMKVYPTLEMDLVGINVNEEGRLKTITVDKYFEADSALRNGFDRCTVTFSEDSLQPKHVSKHNSIWKVFSAKAAEKLLLIVNIPDNGETDTQNDARKLVIPLEKPGMFESSARYFELAPSGILQLKDKPSDAAEPVDVDKKESAK